MKAGNRFMVPPEPKAARDHPAARPAFNLRFAKNTVPRNSSHPENTIRSDRVNAGHGYHSNRRASI